MRLILQFLLLLPLLLPSLQAEPSAKAFFPYQYEKVTLPNGLTAFLMPVKGSGLLAYYTVVRTGSRDEWEPGRSGFAHFFEHMMFRGTEKFPADVYDHMVTEMGANANAYTTDDYTCYYMVVAGRNLEKVMELESDRFQNLSYDEPSFRTEAGAVYGEYRKGRVNPWTVAYESILSTAFQKHTYQHTTIGFERDIKNMPNLYDYSKSFFQRYYRPENAILMIVGDFDPAAAKGMIEKYYGSWAKGYVPPRIETEPPQSAERRQTVTYNGRTLPRLWIGYKGRAFDPSDKMVVAAELLGDLAFGENSEIYKKLVIREQKVQFIGGDFGYNRDPKLYSVHSIIKDEADIDYVIEQVDQAAARFVGKPVAQEELDKIKKRQRYGFLMNLDTPQSIASSLARVVALAGDIEAVNQLFAALDEITPADIQQAAQEFLNKDRRTVIVVKGDR